MTLSATRADVRLLLVLLAVAGHPLPRRCKNPDCGKPRRRRPGRDGYEGAQGYCGPCYYRARKAGFPAVIPPPRSAPAPAVLTAARSARMAERMARYGALRELGTGPHAAAARTGVVAESTVRKYETAYQRDKRRREEAGAVA